MKALVIDDSAATRFILQKLLVEVGFEVAQAEDGKVALELLQKSSDFDLALVDWNMPVMNGLEFIQAARANKAFDKIKMLMVTTETEMTSVVQALSAGANEYVMKPFNKEMILEKMKIMGISGV